MSARTLRIAQYLVRTADLKSRIEGILASPQFKGVDPKFLADLATVDPSGDRGDYLTWIFKNTRLKDSTQGIAWPEDRERVRRALEGFLKLKKEPRYFKKYEASPDINSYKLRTLEALNRRVFGQHSAQESPATEKLAKGVSLFYQDSEFKVLRAGGPGTDIKDAVKGLCELGAGTEWCTREAEPAHSYLERGPVYVIYRNGEKIAQTDRDQLRDVNDATISIYDNLDLWKKLVEIGVISEARFAFEYAYWVKHARYPEGEKHLAGDSEYRGKYIKNGLIKVRWPEAEPFIIKDQNPDEIFTYVKVCLHGQRWPAGEKAMLAAMKDPEKVRHINSLISYAFMIIDGRWPELESFLLEASYPYSIFDYIKKCLDGQRWPEAEEVFLHGDVANRPYLLANYAVEIIRKRWPEAEPQILKNASAFATYTRGLYLDPNGFIEEYVKNHPAGIPQKRKTGSLRNKKRLNPCP